MDNERFAAPRPTGPRGFTLVELMIVVVIIAVLAAIALVAYGKYIASARKSEVLAMFAEVRAKEEAYRAEFSSYYSTGASEDDGWPALGAGEPKPKVWATGAPATWTTLGLAPPANQLYCSYVAIAGAASSLAGAGARGTAALGGVAPTTPWWYVNAACDNDGSGPGFNATNALYITTFDKDTVIEENPGL